jgi:transposase
MDAMMVGIDVSKDRLDVAVRPTGESFVFKRTAAGIEDLVVRLKDRSPALVAIEATGGFEAVVVAGLAGAGLFPWWWSIQRKCLPSRGLLANVPRPTGSML